MPTVAVVAATYFDDRGIGGLEGVSIYYRHPSQGQRAMVEVPVDNWHVLARRASNGECYAKFGPSIVNAPQDEHPSEVFGDHVVAVHVRLAEPLDLDIP